MTWLRGMMVMKCLCSSWTDLSATRHETMLVAVQNTYPIACVFDRTSHNTSYGEAKAMGRLNVVLTAAQHLS